MSSLFNSLISNIEDGRNGDNFGLSVSGYGLDKLDKLLAGVQPGRYDLVGGGTGTGKTALVDLFYVVTPLLNLYNNLETDLDYHIIYNTLEINTDRKIAKLACLLMYLQYGIILDWKELLSYSSDGEILSDKKYNKVKELGKIIDFIESKITFLDGFVNPTRIKVAVEKLAKENGEIYHRIRKVGSKWIKGDIPKDKSKHPKDGYIRKYFPYNKKKIFQVVTDHLGLLSPEREGGNSNIRLMDKKLIDRHSKYCVYYRDFYRFSVVDVSQFNRELADIQRRKHEQLTPQLEDFKQTGNPAENADTVIAMMNPERYNIDPYYDYLIKEMPKLFRAIFVLKNRNGTDMGMLAMRFIGECGHFCDLPNSKELKVRQLYNKVRDKRNKTLLDL